MRGGSNLDEHLAEQRVESARWLMSPAGGSLQPDQVAQRLGISRSNLDKILARKKDT